MNKLKQYLSRFALRYDQLISSFLSFVSKLEKSHIVILILTGLIIRLGGAFLYGTQDMEWWKAWGSYSVQNSVVGAYGAKDKEIIQLWKEGKNRQEILNTTQIVVHYDPYKYFRTEYVFTQPPLFIYSIFFSTRLYQLISPSLENNRVFNFFLNIQPILSSAILALIISWFVSSLAGNGIGRAAGLVYWLNPLVILDAPIQGYQDPMCALFAVISVVMVYRRSLIWAFVFIVLSFMTKPLGVLIAPVILFVGLREYRFGKNLVAWSVAIITGIVVCLPYILSAHFLSMIQGVLSIEEVSTDLSRQAMNIWWPVQYIFNAIHLSSQEGVSLLQALSGNSSLVFKDLPIKSFIASTHINPEFIGFGLLAIFTLFNLLYLNRGLEYDRNLIVLSAVLQVYGYFILRVGVHANHYFILLGVLSLICFVSKMHFKAYVATSFVFLIQDLIFYGFGRDFNYGNGVLRLLYLGWTTNVLALINVSIFILMCYHYYDAIVTKTRA